MKKTNEKGITIITLVITIIILLILASIGVNSGKGTIELAKYDKLRNELTIIQTKVNDLNQENKTEIGQKISTAQKSILNIDTVSNIIYSGRTEAEKAEIEDGFRYCSSNYIEKQFGLDGIDRDYLVNVEYRYVVSCEGLEYKGTIYYMIDQMDSGLYNVEYHNKNSNTGSFDVSAEKVGEKYKISVSNIKHDGYVSNWQVKYKLDTDNNWKTSNKLEFEVENGGNYIIKVVHGNEIDLGKKTLNVGIELVKNNINKVLSTTDNTELIDEKENKIVLPAGFKIVVGATTVDKGIVIEDATETVTKGSQFVWVPVGTITKADGTTVDIELNRYTFDTNGIPKSQGDEYINGYYKEFETSSYGNKTAKSISDFKNSVIQNEGYYIGRYEARTATARSAKTDALTQITEKGTENVYNYVTQLQAAELSQNMYTSNKFTSDLMNSYAWDTAIIFIQNCGTNEKYSVQNSLNTSLSQTGTPTDVQCNIYDMASNIYEWTTETSNDSSAPCILRGGYYNLSYNFTSNRYDVNTSISDADIGFRPLLYL